MSRVRLLAFDIDGTLSPAGQPVPAEVVEALRACIAAGVLVVPATGRKFSSIQRLCERIGLTGPAITCNGAITVDAADGQVRSAHFLGTDLYRSILEAIGGDDRFSLAVFTAADIVCTQDHFAARALQAIGEPVSQFVPSLQSLDPRAVAKVLAATPEEPALQAAYEQYHAQFSGTCSVTTTSSQFLEFMAPGVSKGAALAEIAASRGIGKDRIACIGDSDNDLSLFEVAGQGFAVANATARVLAAATAVVPSATQAGAAWAIREHVLKDSDPGRNDPR